MNNTNWILIQNGSDFPSDTYDHDHRIYLCVLASGKTVVCKYMPWANGREFKNADGSISIINGQFQNAAVWRDDIGTVIAYTRIQIPEDILTHCTGAGIAKSKVEYFDGLN